MITKTTSTKKRRITTTTTTNRITNPSDKPLAEPSHKPSSIHRSNTRHHPTSIPNGFNDPTTADIILRLHLDQSSPSDSSDSSDSHPTVDSSSDFHIYLHSSVLRRSKYFSALLSDRWKKHSSSNKHNNNNINNDYYHFNLSATSSINNHVTVLQLLYTNDISTAIDTVSTALELLPIALELLFEDCVTACLRFLEAAPWTEEEESKVLGLIPLLSEEESEELLARVSPPKSDLTEEVLHGLILTAAWETRPFAKALVVKVLRDFSSREATRRVLDKSFETLLNAMKESLEKYSSPEGEINDMIKIQRVSLCAAVMKGWLLIWVIEMMIELRAADTAVKEWNEQAGFTANLQHAFRDRDKHLKHLTHVLALAVLRCTCKLANAVAAGVILASRQVRMKLVKDWLPVLLVCKDNLEMMLLTEQKSLCLELEETFLKIISTLPMSEAEELLQQCLSFSTGNWDCPHLVPAFTTWFRRANRQLQGDHHQLS